MTDMSPRYAGFWIRSLAFLIDGFILSPFIFLFAFAHFQYDFTLLLISFLPAMFYKPLMEWKKGATIGKMICKIRVEVKEANNLTLESAIIRSAPYLLHSLCALILIYLLFNNALYVNAVTREERVHIMQGYPIYRLKEFIALLGWIDILFILKYRVQKRTIHDLMAGSFCVRTNVQIIETPPPFEPIAGDYDDRAIR